MGGISPKGTTSAVRSRKVHFPSRRSAAISWSNWRTDGRSGSTPPLLLRSTGYASYPIFRARATKRVALSLQSPERVCTTSAGMRGWYPPSPREMEM